MRFIECEPLAPELARIAGGEDRALLQPSMPRKPRESSRKSRGLAASGRIRGGRLAELSDREVEVLAALTRGRTNEQIEKALFISEKTVQHHVAHIYKTGVSTRAAAVSAQANGLLEE